MARNAKEMRIARKGDLYVAPSSAATFASLRTALLADASAAYPAPLDVALGHTDDGGVELEPSKEVGTLGVWSSAAPGLYYLESAGFQATFNLAQHNKAVTELYWDAEWTVTTPSPPATATGELIVSANPPVEEIILAIKWRDQNNFYNHVVIPRATITARQNVTYNRTTGVLHGLTIAAMPEADEEEEVLAYLYTNDTAITGA